jgi:hypothetical protein
VSGYLFDLKGSGPKMKRHEIFCIVLVFLGFYAMAFGVETGQYRLLSISSSEKLIVVSHIPDKTKYILDVASAKITIDGKPAEFKELKSFSIIQLKLELKEDERKGIDIDGSAIEIRVTNSGEPQ